MQNTRGGNEEAVDDDDEEEDQHIPYRAGHTKTDSSEGLRRRNLSAFEQINQMPGAMPGATLS
jgi:hypothetical protein